MGGKPRYKSLLILNQTWLADEFRELGLKVVTAGFGEGGFDVKFDETGVSFPKLLAALPSDFQPEAIIYFDNSSTLWLTGVYETALPAIFYSVDAHHHHAWHPILSQLFDLTLVAQSDYLLHFDAAGVPAQWLPLWAPRWLEPEPEKTIDVCFRGSFSPQQRERAEFFETLSALVPGDYRSGDYAVPYTQSRIVVNQAVMGDLNFRVFEAMMSGALLVTPKIANGMDSLFSSGKELVTYQRDDPRDAAEKIRYYLDHENERKLIAAEGRRKIVECHSAKVRAQQILSYLDNLVVRPKPLLYVSAARCALATAAISRKSDPQSMSRFLLDACEALTRSAMKGEGCSSEFVAAVILTRYCLNEIGLEQDANSLLRGVRELYPDDVILGLALTEQLVQSGAIAEAHEVARSISHSPDELLGAASRLLEDVTERIQRELEQWTAQSA